MPLCGDRNSLYIYIEVNVGASYRLITVCYLHASSHAKSRKSFRNRLIRINTFSLYESVLLTRANLGKKYISTKCYRS